jgi:hypothetical protein
VAGPPITLPPVRDGDPCADVRAEAEHVCAEAEQKAIAAHTQQRRLRELRSEDAAVADERAAVAQARDRRLIADAKDEAAREYRRALSAAHEATATQTAAAVWLRKVDRLNRQARIAATREQELAQRATELHQLLPAIELAADAARIAAEAAQARCAEARRVAIECEEAAGAHDAVGAEAAPAGPAAPVAPQADLAGEVLEPTVLQPRSAPLAVRGTALGELLVGDREPVLRFALLLAGDTGLEPGRLQLLLVELREAIIAGALANHAFRFPDDHPFWSQFSQAGGTQVAAMLSSLGFRFDGQSGWADGRVPQIRDLALALSYAGFDLRSLRRPAGQAAIDTLWQGTVVMPAEWLLQRAPGLELEAVVEALGQRATRLSDLWAIWPQVRELLAH